MKSLRIRHQQMVADPLQWERVRKALTIMLEHQEAPNARRPVCSSLDQSATTRRHDREPTVRAPAAYSALGLGPAART
jgi:hypothetical protein